MTYLSRFSLFRPVATWAILCLTLIGVGLLPARSEPYGVTYASPELVSVISRLPQGKQSLDLPLALAGPATVEPRSGGSNGEFTFIATFTQALTASDVTLVAQRGAKVAGKSTNGNILTVKMTGVDDNQILEILLTGLKSAATPQVGSGGFRVRILNGDVTGDGRVDASDVAAIQAQIGQPVTVTTAIYDIDGTGVIDGNDTHNARKRLNDFKAVPLLTAQQEASRFLGQATFGPTTADISSVIKLGEAGWIDDQFKKHPIRLDPLVHSGANKYNKGSLTGISSYRADAWWQAVMEGDDLLRQRVAFALSEIFVISDVDSNVNYWTVSAADYYDTLTADAFGNYHDLMLDVTMHPAMGMYLTYLYNTKGDPTTGSHPDENYARELMQLFTVGLYQLNQDGTQKLDGNGQAIPTYGNAEVTNFARVYTGLSLGGARQAFYWPRQNYDVPMITWDDYHDQDAKTLLVYPNSVDTNLPAGRTTLQDIHSAMNNIFNHPNVGPFVSRRLIQRLVTSNPSADYVSRVAGVFNDNGKGVRGDLKAVIKAILLDDEARDVSNALSDPEHGKLRESWLRAVHLARSFDAHVDTTTSTRPILRWQLYDLNNVLGMEELRSPSVFNFFTPDYQPPGPVLDDGLFGPEFQITNASTVTSAINYFRNTADVSFDPYGGKIYLGLGEQIRLSKDPLAMIDNIDLLLTGGTLGAGTRASVLNMVNQIPFSHGDIRARSALTTLINSPDYSIQK